jgi:hypothetical protein
MLNKLIRKDFQEMIVIGLKKWVFKTMEATILYQKIGLKDQIIQKMNKEIFLTQLDW